LPRRRPRRMSSNVPPNPHRFTGSGMRLQGRFRATDSHVVAGFECRNLNFRNKEKNFWPVRPETSSHPRTSDEKMFLDRAARAGSPRQKTCRPFVRVPQNQSPSGSPFGSFGHTRRTATSRSLPRAACCSSPGCVRSPLPVGPVETERFRTSGPAYPPRRAN